MNLAQLTMNVQFWNGYWPPFLVIKVIWTPNFSGGPLNYSFWWTVWPPRISKLFSALPLQNFVIAIVLTCRVCKHPRVRYPDLERHVPAIVVHVPLAALSDLPEHRQGELQVAADLCLHMMRDELHVCRWQHMHLTIKDICLHVCIWAIWL